MVLVFFCLDEGEPLQGMRLDNHLLLVTVLQGNGFRTQRGDSPRRAKVPYLVFVLKVLQKRADRDDLAVPKVSHNTAYDFVLHYNESACSPRSRVHEQQ
jgi:hypothetical protein